MPIIARTMAEASLPKRLDARRLADDNEELKGSVDGQKLQRIVEAVESIQTAVGYHMVFGRDAEGVRNVTGKCSVRVDMTCQRCLESVALDVEGNFCVGLVYSDEEARHLPKRFEPALMDQNGNIDPLEILEDELLLALPMFANHADGECTLKQPDAVTEEIESDSSGKENPFEVLRQLKSK